MFDVTRTLYDARATAARAVGLVPRFLSELQKLVSRGSQSFCDLRSRILPRLEYLHFHDLQLLPVGLVAQLVERR